MIDNPNILYYLKHNRKIPCQNCFCRKEIPRQNIPTPCSECSHLNIREEHYVVYLPVWKEGYIPTKKESKETVVSSANEIKNYKIVEE